eukprot:TRINITY_DN1522_c3_g1_i1.p1 TRINITY_DN1522_c3_g1~~TRINITY_DN1522_c3_g1_i1.p1  ORF type:complete len:569 (+),score=97.35 TRINITY_DN1522_c3_g1_i1:73-1707(+)
MAGEGIPSTTTTEIAKDEIINEQEESDDDDDEVKEGSSSEMGSSSEADLPVLLPVPGGGVLVDDATTTESLSTASSPNISNIPSTIPEITNHNTPSLQPLPRQACWTDTETDLQIGSEASFPHTVPVHGTGSYPDLTGTWEFIKVCEVDGSQSESLVGSLEMDHSSFGHLVGSWNRDNLNTSSSSSTDSNSTSSYCHSTSTPCHGWYWGGSGYIQINLPPDDLSSLNCSPSSGVSYLHSHQKQLLTLKIAGYGKDGFLRIRGDRRPFQEEVVVSGHEQSHQVDPTGTSFLLVVKPKNYSSAQYGDEETRDLIIEVQGSRFHVHTAVLTTFMPHLRTILSSGMKESQENIIPCPCDSPHAWSVLVERIYDITGCFHASAALKVLPLLDKYQIPKLWSEAITELKRLPQSPRPHPHVLDLLCRCEAHDVADYWLKVLPPDPDELVLFVKDCQEPEATRIVVNRAASRWKKETADLAHQVAEVSSSNKMLQGHIDSVRQVVNTHSAPAAVWRLQTVVVPDFYISNNLPPVSATSTHQTSFTDGSRYA